MISVLNYSFISENILQLLLHKTLRSARNPGRFGRVVSALVGEPFRLGRFGPESFRPNFNRDRGKDRGGCCWWGGVGPISIGIETNERTE